MFSILSVFGAPAIGILCLLVLAALSYLFLAQTTVQGEPGGFLERQISRLGLTSLPGHGRNRVTNPLAAQVPEAVQLPRRLVEQDGDAGGVHEEAVDGEVGHQVVVVAPVPEQDRQVELLSEPRFANFWLRNEDVEINFRNEIGKGSFAVVYEAQVKNVGYRCAAKKLHGNLLQRDSYVIKNFIRECEILSSLQHPSIVKFVGVSKDKEVIVMEMLFASLTDFIDSNVRSRKGLRKLEVPEKHRILYDVALGLQYLHEQVKPIFHRDLTANNVLLTQEHQPIRAKIADLGQAMIKENDTQYMTQAPGTMCYMPPEVLLYRPTYDHSIDIFSFGVLILHSMSEKWPLPRKVIVENRITGELVRRKSELEKRSVYVEEIRPVTPLTSIAEKCLNDLNTQRPSIVRIIASLSSAIAQDIEGNDSTHADRSLCVSYKNDLVDHKSTNLKISLDSSSNNFSVVVCPPIRVGFTGTYLKTVPLSYKLLYSPVDVAINKEGAIFVCDYKGNVGVHKYDTNSGAETNLLMAASRKGKISQNTCYYPRGIATDGEGYVYLADTHSHRVLKISPEGQVPVSVGEALVAGSGAHSFNEPTGIGVFNKHVYVCDTKNHRVRILDARLTILKTEFCQDERFTPIDIAFGKYIYVLDEANKTILVFETPVRQDIMSGPPVRQEPIEEFNLATEERYSLKKPQGICVDANNFIYVTDSVKQGVLVLNQQGKFIMFFGEGQLYTPRGIAVDKSGHVYVCDSGNKNVKVFV